MKLEVDTGYLMYRFRFVDGAVGNRTHDSHLKKRYFFSPKLEYVLHGKSEGRELRRYKFPSNAPVEVWPNYSDAMKAFIEKCK